MKVFPTQYERRNNEKRENDDIMNCKRMKLDSPSWIPRMAEPEGLEIFNKIQLLIPFLDATNGRARKVSNSFSC